MPDTFLVSGDLGGLGWLYEIRFSGTSGAPLVSTNAAVFAGKDIVALAYSPLSGLLFGIDEVTHSLVAASYQPGPIIGTWQVIATAQQCPILNKNSAFIEMTALAGTSGVKLETVEPYEGHQFTVSGTPSGWVVTDVSNALLPVILPPTWTVSASPTLAVSSSIYELWIGGGSGAFLIVDVDTSLVVYAGSHNGAAGGQVFNIPVPMLDYGKLYKIVDGAGQGLAESQPFRVEHVWDRVSVTPNVVPSRIAVRWDFPAVGTDFISWELLWGGPGSSSPPADTIVLTMAIGGWDYNVNPTVPFGLVDILGSSWGTLGTQVVSWDNRGHLSFGWTFAVNNPAFIGLNVAMQAVGVTASGTYIVSDVAGVVLVQ